MHRAARKRSNLIKSERGLVGVLQDLGRRNSGILFPLLRRLYDHDSRSLGGRRARGCPTGCIRRPVSEDVCEPFGDLSGSHSWMLPKLGATAEILHSALQSSLPAGLVALARKSMAIISQAARRAGCRGGHRSSDLGSQASRNSGPQFHKTRSSHELVNSKAVTSAVGKSSRVGDDIFRSVFSRKFN